MNTILAVFDSATLVEGKFVIKHNNRVEELYPTKYCKIQEPFNPKEDSVLTKARYPRCVVNSSKAERDAYQKSINKAIEQATEKLKNGDRIHLSSKRGQFTFIRLERDLMVITCAKWLQAGEKAQLVPRTAFKCRAGTHEL